MTQGHTHQIKHFCSNQQKVGVQGGECATPATCDTAKLERAVELVRTADLGSWEMDPDKAEAWERECDEFLASLSSSESSRSSAGNPDPAPVGSGQREVPEKSADSESGPTAAPKAEDTPP